MTIDCIQASFKRLLLSVLDVASPAQMQANKHKSVFNSKQIFKGAEGWLLAMHNLNDSLPEIFSIENLNEFGERH